MTCPYLDYRRSDETHEFDHDRPYCTAQATFLSPVKADICNDRFDFDHRDCEVFRAVEDEQSAELLVDD